MNNYIINGQKISTNLNRNTIYELTRPVISYPYSFTNKIRKIVQEFIVGSEYIPAFDPTLKHSIYNQASIINQTEAEAEPAGFAKFSREYIEFIGSEIHGNPQTLTYTYPFVYYGVNALLRLRQTSDEDTSSSSYTAIRANPLTENVAVTEKWELINVSNPVVDYSTPASGIPLGSNVGYANSTWTVISINGSTLNLSRTNEDEETITASASRSSVLYYNTEPDFNKIITDKPFVVTDDYFSAILNPWFSERNLDFQGQVSNFVDDATTPNTATYLGYVASGEKFPLQESEIEHLGGYVYVKKTLYGSLK